jgi:hypothetical protein
MNALNKFKIDIAIHLLFSSDMPKGVYQRKSEEQRFWEKVDIKEEDECWLWNASKDPDGYGYFSLDTSGPDKKKKTILAHRYSLMMKLNDFNLSSEIFACHSCDENYDKDDKTYRSCVNPKHLYADTCNGNSQRMVELNRQSFGEKNPNAKLTEEIAKKILEEYTTDVQNGHKYGSHIRLGKKYNVDKQVINRLISGKTWTHLQ